MTEYPTPARLYDAYIFDLDGTCYLGDALLPTVGETIERLRQLGRRTVFLSNNPTQPREVYAERLTELGLPTPPEDVINSSMVMADFLNRHMPGARLFVVGEEPLRRELAAAGFEIVGGEGDVDTVSIDAAAIDAVIASFDRTFDYRKLQIAFDAIRAGARFFATNADRYCPVPGGGQPDAAAVIAAIEACTTVSVEAVVGKPSAHMAEAVLARLQLSPRQCLMIGDRLETDVLLGLNASMDAALILTGATDETMLARSAVRPDFVLRALSELVPVDSL